MKKLFTIIATLIFAIGAFAQNATVEGNLTALNKTLSDSYVEFILPDNVSSEEVARSAQFYVDYFKVNYDEASKLVKITLLDGEDDISRKVISRFLVSTGVRAITFEDQEYSIMEFYNQFMKIEE